MKPTSTQRLSPYAWARHKMTRLLSRKFPKTIQTSSNSHEADLRYRALFEQSNDAVFILDFDGRHLQANRRAGELLGYTPADIVGLSSRDLIVPEQYEQSRHVIQRLLAGETVRPYERIFRHRDGHYIPTEINVEVVRDNNGSPLHIQSVVRDITERKQIEDSLRQSEALYRSMFEENQAVKLLVDPETGEIIDANTAAVNFYGYTRDQLLSMRIQAINTLPDAEVRAGMQMARSEQQKVFNFRHRLASGEVRDVEVFSGPIEVQGHRYLFSIILDVTARRQTEDALRESEAKYRLITENTSDGIAIIDGASNRITYASPTYDRLWGRAVGESINLSAEHHYASIHPDDRDRVYHLIGETLAQESAMLSLTYRAKHKQGHYFWKEDRVRVVQTPDQSSFLAYVISTDVTERKQIEDALLASEERLRSILENMLDCIWSIDLRNNRLTYINAAVERITGRPPAAFFENPGLWLEIIHPDDRRDEDFSSASKDISSEWTGRIVRPDGEVRWLTIRNWLVKDEHGNPVRIEGIANDTTERKLAQQREIELMLERERRLLLGTFIQNAAHEFRTPLATISSGTYLMVRSDDPERREEKAVQIEEQVKRITRLIDSLLLMVQLENTKDQKLKPVNIGMLIKASCQKVANKCRKQHNLLCDIEPVSIIVMGDTEQLIGAFEQILDNACRYTPEVGTVSVNLWSESQRVWVEIKDSGPGIAEDSLDRIFDTFWRQDTAHSTPGLGLGLSIARRVIERHAGKIIVTSEVGRGTTLRVTLPLVAQMPMDEYQPADSGAESKS